MKNLPGMYALEQKDNNTHQTYLMNILPQIPYIIGRRLKDIYDYEQS